MIKKGEKKKGKVEKKGNVDIKLDIEQDVYPAWELSIDQKNFLANHDYVLGNFRHLKGIKQKENFVKKRPPEGALHTFYVNAIFNEVKKFTKEVKKYRTERGFEGFAANRYMLIKKS